MKKRKVKNKGDLTSAKAGLYSLPIPALVSTIDMMVDILRERGVIIRDWDDKSKVVMRVKCIGNKVYVLAPKEE